MLLRRGEGGSKALSAGGGRGRNPGFHLRIIPSQSSLFHAAIRSLTIGIEGGKVPFFYLEKLVRRRKK